MHHFIFLAWASSRFLNGDTNGDLELRQAAIVSAESTHRNMAPNSISFPTLSSDYRKKFIRNSNYSSGRIIFQTQVNICNQRSKFNCSVNDLSTDQFLQKELTKINILRSNHQQFRFFSSGEIPQFNWLTIS